MPPAACGWVYSDHELKYFVDNVHGVTSKQHIKLLFKQSTPLNMLRTRLDSAELIGLDWAVKSDVWQGLSVKR